MIKVKDYPSLYRDEKTGAIINRNNFEYQQRLKAIKSSNKQEEEFDVGTLTGPTTPTASVNWNSNLNKNITKYLKVRGRIISPSVATPAVSIASSASSNLNIFINNSPSGDGIYASGGAKGVSSGQPGGNAISITNNNAYK